MEIPSGGCGAAANQSVTDYKWRYRWQKSGLLVVSAYLPESGSTRVKPNSARISQQGNLLVVGYEDHALPPELDAKGRELLPVICASRVLVTFSIRGLDSNHYYLVVGRETDRGFRVQEWLRIDEPE